MLSWGHAASGVGVGIPSPDEAHVLALALHTQRSVGVGDWIWLWNNLTLVVPNPQLVPLWIGVCLFCFGTAGIYLWSLPFHAMMAVGLWRGGSVLGGAAGGAWALLGGLAAAGTLAISTETLLDFPLAASVAFVAGAAMEERWSAAVYGLAAAAAIKLAALPVLAVVAVDVLIQFARTSRLPSIARVLPAVGLVLALYLPNLGHLQAYAGESAGGAALGATPVGQRVAYHLESVVTVAGPALLGGVVAGLLGRGDLAILRLLGWALGVLAGLAPLSFFAQVRYALPVVPLLAIAGAGARGGSRWVLVAVALTQFVGFHLDRDAWPNRPVALRAAEGARFDVDRVLDWLILHAPPIERAHAAIHIAGSDRLHFGLFAVRALERDLPLELVVVDDHRPLSDPTELGVLITIKGHPTVREGWRAALPPPTETWTWPEGYTVELWDRGLPLESQLAEPAEALRRNHPRQQGVWLYDGQEQGPLIEHASSPAALRSPAGWEVVFVRDQALWWASSPDGTTFGSARALADEAGPINAFDPSLSHEPGGGIRLLAAELVGSDRALDPALHATRIVEWIGADLEHLRRVRVLYEGLGAVDPVLDDSGLYFTEGRTRVRRAMPGEAGYAVDPVFVEDGLTVPELAPEGLIGQIQVMGWSVLVLDRTPGAADGRVSLELCGTGASLVEGRLYYSRSSEACSVVLPRRRAALDQLVRR